MKYPRKNVVKAPFNDWEYYVIAKGAVQPAEFQLSGLQEGGKIHLVHLPKIYARKERHEQYHGVTSPLPRMFDAFRYFFLIQTDIYFRSRPYYCTSRCSSETG